MRTMITTIEVVSQIGDLARLDPIQSTSPLNFFCRRSFTAIRTYTPMADPREIINFISPLSICNTLSHPSQTTRYVTAVNISCINSGAFLNENTRFRGWLILSRKFNYFNYNRECDMKGSGMCLLTLSDMPAGELRLNNSFNKTGLFNKMLKMTIANVR